MTLEPILADAEEKFQAAADALLVADPLALERCCALLREGATELANALSSPRPHPEYPQYAQRIQALGERLTHLRDQLARVLALASSQAAAMLPPQDAATYGQQGNAAPRMVRAAA
ncbi:MAG: hypothetical protein QM740_09735 [Acidovorax sp.]